VNARLLRAVKIHRHALPWVLLKKWVAPWLKTETVIIYGRSLQTDTLFASGTMPVVTVVGISDTHSALSRNLCSAFPEYGFAGRLRRPGHQCYVALQEGVISGYAWVAHDSLRIDEIAYRYSLGKREVFIYDCFVENACRGKGIYQTMLRAIVEDYGSRGEPLERALIAASSLNHASIRGIGKAGFIELKRISYLAWLGRHRWRERERVPGREAEIARAAIDGEF
jgi:GNAT superfamily N-acetyltransferase